MKVKSKHIVEYLNNPRYKPHTFSELASYFGIPSKGRRRFKKTLRELEEQGAITLNKDKRYQLGSSQDFITGTIDKNPKGFGFLIPDDSSIDDIYIKPGDLKDAMHHDKVAVILKMQKRHRGQSLSGQVVKIIERTHEKGAGQVFQKGQDYFVETDFGETFLIPATERNETKPNDLVEITITQFPTSHSRGVAKVIKVLGKRGEPRAETDAIIANHKLYTEFSKNTLFEATQIPNSITEKELEGRKDLRNFPIITIDGEDARDFDDAVYVAKTDKGYKLYVSIADVAHYVKENTALDTDAYKRGCSTYFPDKVLPMLPEKLSNNICSLKPNEDRLTLTCEIDFSDKGERLRYKVYESVIKSTARMTYTLVQKIFDKDITTCDQYKNLLPMMETMYELFLLLKQQREKSGALDFDLPEPYVIVDAQGKTIDIQKRDREHSHMLIEEFMIAANEAVAHCLSEKNQPTLYRTHEKPDEEKIRVLNILLHNLGYNFTLSTEGPKAFSNVLKEVAGKPEENLVNIVLLRSMKQAKYTAGNLKHFALASSFYTHFTSPIRRYPDLIVHRSLKKLNKWTDYSDEGHSRSLKSLGDKGVHLSERERISEEAEREVVKYKKVLFMENKVGQTFSGHISGLKEFGLFVELDQYFVEGLVHVESLTDDFYQFIEEQFLLRGLKRKREFKLGDQVEVRISQVDLSKKEIDLELVE